MNPQTFKEAERLFEAADENAKGVKNAEIVICPPFVYLSSFKFQASSFKFQASSFEFQASSLKLGSQDCFWEQKCAYTGEVSAWMLKNLGCKYVIIGHSERRKYFNETNESINKKIKAIFEAGLRPILCVGEKYDEKEVIKEILEKQLSGGLVGTPASKITDLIIAYEPVWAISSEEGEYCSPEYAFSAGLIIKKFLFKEYDKTIVDKIRIIYGGSVDGNDAASYIKEGKMAGVLVGKASLNAAEFGKIIKNMDAISS